MKPVSLFSKSVKNLIVVLLSFSVVVSSLTVTAKAEIIDNTSSNSFNTESINVFDNENIDEISDEDMH